MIKHQETHPNLDVPDCFGCKISTVSVPSSVTPTRRAGAQHAKWVNDTENRWHKDMPAYKRLVEDGLQPPRIDGCAELEAKASSKQQIEAGCVSSG
jgi:hypothetical protein